MVVEKVVLPKEVAEAIEELRGQGLGLYELITTGSYSESVIYDFLMVGSIDDNFEAYVTGLINGYVIEPTPHDQVRDLYTHYRDFGLCTTAKAIRETLDILGIKITGVNDEN